MNSNKRKEIMSHLMSIIGVSLFLIVATVGFYIPKKENMLSALAFLQNQSRFYMQDLSSGVLLKDAIPVPDEIASTYEPYRFKVVNTSNKEIEYRIVFNNNEEKVLKQGKQVLPNKYLRYSILEENKEITEASNLTEDGIIYTTAIPANSEVVYEFRMWLDYNADNGAMNKTFIGTIEIEEIK